MNVSNAAALVKSKSFWTLSFSGAGHLLPYHLGAARRLLVASRREQQEQEQDLDKVTRPPPRIQAIAGSSSGAIAAAVMALLPHRLDEYADRFLQDRGHALRNLSNMLQEEADTPSVSSSITASDKIMTSPPSSPLLVICTTRCFDGSVQLFEFSTDDETRRDPSKLLRAIKASCTIPPTFHPYDIISNGPLSYPDDGGIEIDGLHYVDGGIVAPAPPTPFDTERHTSRIVISPISGINTTTTSSIDNKSVRSSLSLPVSEYSIRPTDTSWSLWPWTPTASRGGTTFRIRPSVQNVRALVGSMGGASPDVLKGWYDRGSQDAQVFLDDWSRTSRP